MHIWWTSNTRVAKYNNIQRFKNVQFFFTFNFCATQAIILSFQPTQIDQIFDTFLNLLFAIPWNISLHLTALSDHQVYLNTMRMKDIVQKRQNLRILIDNLLNKNKNSYSTSNSKKTFNCQLLMANQDASIFNRVFLIVKQ